MTTRQPYELDAPRVQLDSEEWRRCQRSRRLVQFARDLASWERGGLIDHPRYAEKVAYRRACLARWEAYLDGKIDPPEGRKPHRD